MKSIKAISLLSILALFVVFTSCEKEDAVVTDIPVAEKTGMDEIPELEQLIDPITSGFTYDQDLELKNDGLPSEIEEGFDSKKAIYGRKKFMYQRLFDTLNLTNEQIRKLKYTYEQYHNCRYKLHVQLRRLNKQYIEKANTYKTELYAKYRKGDITKAEFEKYLKEFHYKLKKAIKEDKRRLEIIRQLKVCHKNFIENIRLILTKDQWELFKEFHKKLKDYKDNKEDRKEGSR